MGKDKVEGPFVVSIVRDATNSSSIVVHLRMKKEDLRFTVESKKLKRKKQAIEAILKSKNFKFQSLKRIKDPKFTTDIISFEEKFIMKHYKVGVLYCKEGQKDQREMFSNERASSEFKAFLKILGDKVALKGFSGYAGGLDTTPLGSTGEYSIHSSWRDYELMFHISTMLPYCNDDPQQLQRKRHLGNDIVLVVFKEGNLAYSPSTVTSMFNQVIIVVQPVQYKNECWYRLSVAHKLSLKSFGPPLPEPALFQGNEVFRDFLITKIINGERAAYRAEPIESKLIESRLGLLSHLEQSFTPLKNLL
uniref:Rap-GAP domain-containing protein n=1 Tax=Arcella intermedia TaxID=1963864 RepID=A0A6B2L9J1_9EUKA